MGLVLGHHNPNGAGPRSRRAEPVQQGVLVGLEAGDPGRELVAVLLQPVGVPAAPSRYSRSARGVSDTRARSRHSSASSLTWSSCSSQTRRSPAQRVQLASDPPQDDARSGRGDMRFSLGAGPGAEAPSARFL